MNAHSANAVARLRSLPDVVAEYDAKAAGITEALAAFEAAGSALKIAATVAGEHGGEKIDTGYVREDTLRRNLLVSAWQHVWKGLNLPSIASANDKRKWEQSMASPAPFTLDNLRATFGPYLENPRATILRGLAEVFSSLDPAYKSHEKVKIGVKGLPKRVVLYGFGGFIGGRYHSGGIDRVRDILNALAAYQRKPLLTHAELSALEKNGEALRDGGELPDPFQSRAERSHNPKTIKAPARGVWLKTFQNGNGHLFFGPDALLDINRALAEFYGDVLPDSPEADAERPAPRAGSTAVARDLQFYPTPQKVIDGIVRDLRDRWRGDLTGLRVLEPSCGDGRIMDALRGAGARVFGVEVDAGRVVEAKNRGHLVLRRNFLEVEPGVAGGLWSDFDLVVMNPPFYGRHYAKHVRHALRFLKPGGKLVAILPATARYDHCLLDDLRPDWEDLPVGAFAESGTNVCTTVATIRAPREGRA
jgi:hypothetical protein